MSTGIQWTEATWNPTTGCDKISPGCGLPRFEGDATGGCYALTMAKRLKAMGQAKYQNDGDPRTSGPGFGVTIHPGALTLPLHWRKPRMIFVDSMSDLFHARVPEPFIGGVWNTMALSPQHTYQVLTKRSPRMRRVLRKWADADWYWQSGPGQVPEGCSPIAGPLRNVWVGTSIELDEYACRADDLRGTPSAVRFLSLEPLLGPLPSLSFEGIDWAIIGGESGKGARPLDLGWVRELVARGQDAGTAMFVKQLGTCWAHGRSKHDHGGDWDDWPADLRVRDFPQRAEVSAA